MIHFTPRSIFHITLANVLPTTTKDGGGVSRAYTLQPKEKGIQATEFRNSKPKTLSLQYFCIPISNLERIINTERTVDVFFHATESSLS